MQKLQTQNNAKNIQMKKLSGARQSEKSKVFFMAVIVVCKSSAF